MKPIILTFGICMWGFISLSLSSLVPFGPWSARPTLTHAISLERYLKIKSACSSSLVCLASWCRRIRYLPPTYHCANAICAQSAGISCPSIPWSPPAIWLDTAMMSYSWMLVIALRHCWGLRIGFWLRQRYYWSFVIDTLVASTKHFTLFRNFHTGCIGCTIAAPPCQYFK